MNVYVEKIDDLVGLPDFKHIYNTPEIDDESDLSGFWVTVVFEDHDVSNDDGRKCIVKVCLPDLDLKLSEIQDLAIKKAKLFIDSISNNNHIHN